ncbi:PepSY domain-containing protein [Pseudomonas syringae]|nr:PepSY domain-containing protein [Pseudomonas syringae]MBD8576154.1 PepSY domain-containing protein [Pseudomonas syringae]MBD8792328.1 PepSY domain-containing protein [Pseudomonas syringae]MBD8802202.1 PepSY domain-containing protein [Pseudomonas syringae]MBD8813971.1 PepSY domain-containing protein [Pseudomonas syringae]
MKTFAALFVTPLLAMTATLAVAHDIGPDEALRLRDTGTIQSFEKLNAVALAAHPGATITETELENEYGNYVYQLDIRDAKGVDWDLEIDAVTGRITKNHQDD